MLRRYLNWLLIFIGSMALGLAGSRMLSVRQATVRAFDGVHPKRSFLLQTTQNMFTASGTFSRTKLKTYARFGDGTVMFSIRQTIPEAELITMQILDPNKDARIFVDEVTKSVTTIKPPKAVFSEMMSELSSEGCPSGVDLSKLPESEEILGVKTRYYVDETPAITDERWIVPDLNCIILKEIQTSHELGGAHNEMMATSITFGEPPARLRTIPPFFAERAPKQVQSLHLAATGHERWGPAGLKLLSKYYWPTR